MATKKSDLGRYSDASVSFFPSYYLYIVIYLRAFSQQLRLYGVEWKGDKWMMNWKGCRRKRLWPDLRYCPGICLDGLRITAKNLRISDLQDEIWTRDLPNIPTHLYNKNWLYITNSTIILPHGPLSLEDLLLSNIHVVINIKKVGSLANELALLCLLSVTFILPSTFIISLHHSFSSSSLGQGEVKFRKDSLTCI
jgi:hypothetical protein